MSGWFVGRGIGRRLAIGGIAVASAAASLLASAAPQAIAADCAQWNISGTWATAQGNGYNVTFNFLQSGQDVSGSALSVVSDVAGNVNGTLAGSKLDLIVTWGPNGSAGKGHYTATVVNGGIADGASAPVGGPSSAATSWTGTGPTICASDVVTAPTPSIDPEQLLLGLLTGGAKPLKPANAQEAKQESGNLLKRFRALPGVNLTGEVDDAVAVIGYLGAARDAAGQPLYPSLANGGMQKVLLKMAYNAATAPDGPTETEATTATNRLIALLANQDIFASKAATP